MKSHVDADGRWRHKFGASWLRTAALCPQRALLEHRGEAENIESDAACVGTAMHLGAEVCLSSGGLTLSDTLAVAQDEFSRLMALDGTNGDPEAKHAEGTFRWIKYDEPKARKLVEMFTTNWWTLVLPTLNLDALTEWAFTVPLVDTEQRVVEMAGTSDYVDTTSDVVDIKDWKTSGGGVYKPWEHQRWDVQASVYTYAASQQGWLGGDPDFELVVMHAPSKRDPDGVQRIPLTRDQRHWNWLRTQCEEIAQLIEAGLPSWPRVDSSALCSPKWCPSWSGCRGKDMGDNPW